MEERTLLYFCDNPRYLLESYVDSGEGLDRAGGFAVQVCLMIPSDHPPHAHTYAVSLQGLGGLLIRKIEGDYHNAVGFPVASFFRFLDLLVEEEDDFLQSF